MRYRRGDPLPQGERETVPATHRITTIRARRLVAYRALSLAGRACAEGAGKAYLVRRRLLSASRGGCLVSGGRWRISIAARHDDGESRRIEQAFGRLLHLIERDGVDHGVSVLDVAHIEADALKRAQLIDGAEIGAESERI